MKVAIVSHSYLEPEAQKNIAAISAYCEVRCMVPRCNRVLLFKNYVIRENPAMRGIIVPYRTLRLSDSQYLFYSWSMGLYKFKPDVINVEMNPWSLIFLQVILYRWLFCRKAKLVCTVKKNTYRLKSGIVGKIKNWLARYSTKRVHHVIAASRMAAEIFTCTLQVPNSRISLCHYLGIDVTLFKPRQVKSAPSVGSSASVIVGYCGRFDEEKGVVDLVEAVRILRCTAGHNVRLKLLGGGSYRDFLDDYIRMKSREFNWLDSFPPVSNADVATFLRTLDIFVLPARVTYDHQEHDARALLEAMATGLACVGTRSGIIPEILRDGGGGLAEPGDPVNLAEVINDLICNLTKRLQMGAFARRRAVDEFSLDIIANRKYEIFTRCI